MNRACLLVLLMAACGGGTATPDGAAPPLPDAGPFLYRTCDPAVRIGDFKIQLEESFTAVSGSIASGVVPGDVPVLVAQENDCRLLRRRNLFCDPACDALSTCGEDWRCVPAPVGRSAGAVAIGGLAAPVTMMPSPVGQHYDFTRLPHPGFQPGAEVVLAADGGEVGPFVLQGRGVAPVELSGDKLTLDPSKALELRWTPGPAGPARLLAADRD